MTVEPQLNRFASKNAVHLTKVCNQRLPTSRR